MKIGCVKEIKNNEFRVGLTPDNGELIIQSKKMEMTTNGNVEG